MAAQQQYAFRAQKSLGLVNGDVDYQPVDGFESPETAARTYSFSPDGRLYAYALPTEVRIFQCQPTALIQTLALPNIYELHFSPRGTYLSTWERPQKLEDVDGQPVQHKNLRIHRTSDGTEVVSFTQKAQSENFGWDVQYTDSESHAVRLIAASGEIQVFRPALWGATPGVVDLGLVDKLKVEGASAVSLSPGANPSIAIFVAEKKGMPASVRIHTILPSSAAGGKVISPTPTCQKTFFKADRSTLKWNCLGTQVLLQTTVDVDNSNKSYYGETVLYLLSAAGNFDSRVQLDKEGPVHDFNWSPNGKEFGVVYGYMPAKTILFSQRLQSLHEFPAAPVNFIQFNPQGRLIALAGFGNLAGKIDIIDRRSLSKISTISAPNTSYCEWSADGLRLLTATCSPRLRVDNGIKVWWVGSSTPSTPGAIGEGSLVHVQEIEELYQASWRPLPSASQHFPNTLPPPPTASPAAIAYLLSKPSNKSGGSVPGTPGTPGAPEKKAGAYRPPGARGLATPAIFKREDEGGLPSHAHPSISGSGRDSGGNTPTGGNTPRNNMVPGSYGYGQQQQNGHGHGHGHQQQRGPRHVPGSHPGAPPGGPNGAGPDGEKKGRKRSKGGKKGLEGEGEHPEGGEQQQQQQQHQPRNGGGGSGEKKGKRQNQNQNGNGNGNGNARPPKDGQNGQSAAPPPPPPVDLAPSTGSLVVDTDLGPTTPGLDSAAAAALDPVMKKMRNLNKKLKAIDELKEKAKRGERLEATQLKKMEGEAEIRKELAGLSVASPA